jgi:iron complex outermembrane receptor protein
MNSHKFLMGIGAAVWAGIPIAGSITAANAQQAGDARQETAATAENTQQGGAIADIVVTAERRATNLQDTPLSIVAVTQETVAAKGIEDLQDLAKFTPNLSISAARGTGNNVPNFVIRGISGGAGATSERGVGLYIDGVYVPRTSGAVLRVLDIDRIEVLRGPQGTLFGRNSTGGAIRIFSKQPTHDAEGYVRGTVGNFGRTDIVGMVNLPVSDSFAIRAQAAYLDEDGYVRRGTEKLGAQRDVVGRVLARWEPAAGLRATVGLLYSDSKANGTPLVFREFDMRPGIEGVIQGNFADWINDAFKRDGQPPLQPYNDPRLVRGPYHATDLCFLDDFNPDYDAACNQYNNNEYWQADLTLGYDVSDTVSLSAISGYAKLKHRGFSDFQVLGTEIRNDDVDSTVFYQEAQLNAELFSAVDLVLGGNYFYEKAEAPNFIINRRGTSVYPNNPGTPPDDDGGLFRLADTFTKQISNSYGIFASATWHVTDKFNLTGGLRQGWDQKHYQQTRWPANDFVPAPGTSSTTVESGKTFSALDYRATADYHFNDDIMAYATVSKAYKAGQFSYTIVSWTARNQATGPAQSAGIHPIPNEKVINYEIGARMTLFNGRLRVNPTLFHMDYTNRQAAVQVTCGTGVLIDTPPGPTCPLGFLVRVQNQGNVALQGIEIDAQLALTDTLMLDAGGGITDPKLKKGTPAGTVHLYPDAPSPTFNVGATYRFEASIGKATVNLNYAYVGKQATHPSEGTDSSYTLPAYGLVNARVQFQPAGLPITASIFVNNLLDNTYATYAQRFGGGYWDSGSGVGPAAAPRSALAEVRGRPREAGLTLQYNF